MINISPVFILGRGTGDFPFFVLSLPNFKKEGYFVWSKRRKYQIFCKMLSLY